MGPSLDDSGGKRQFGGPWRWPSLGGVPPGGVGLGVAAPPDGWGWGCPHRLAVAREKAWGTQGAGPAGPVEQMPCVGLRGWAERSLAAGGLGIWSAHADSRRLRAPAGWEMGPVVDRQAEYLGVFSWKTPGTPRWAAVGSRICTDRPGGIAWNPSPPPTGRSGGRNQGPIHGRRLGDRKPATRGQAYAFTVRQTRRSRFPLREPRPLHADSVSFSASPGPAAPAVDNGQAAYLAV